MRRKRLISTLCVLSIAAVLTFLFLFAFPGDSRDDGGHISSETTTLAEPRCEVLSTPGIRYTESLRALDNPERGFYTPAYFQDMESGFHGHPDETRLIHLRINLGEFSHAFLRCKGRTPDNYQPGGWEPLPEDFLNALNEAMDEIRSHGCTAVVRFAYDAFEGISDMEPEMRGILSHIDQLKPFFAANEDVILSVESGLVGQYGEQHSSAVVSPSYSLRTSDTIYTVVDALLDAVPASVSVTVRRPTYAAYACGMTLEELKAADFFKEDRYYRVGVFNDGMFGSEDDLDTYQDRLSEIAWLDRQARHTAYGGETNYNHSTDGRDYTDGNYACREMFQTHLSYLNGTWPEETIDGWKNTPYQGSDPLYLGQSTYTFLENHMGYRYVLRGFDFRDSMIQFQIENVGAGNMLKPKTTALILVDESANITEVPTDIDVRNWDSRTISSESVPIHADDGVYQVFLRITDENGNQVQLANDNRFTENGNLIGTISLRTS